MSPTLLRRTVALFVTAALVVVACSGNDDAGRDDPVSTEPPAAAESPAADAIDEIDDDNDGLGESVDEVDEVDEDAAPGPLDEPGVVVRPGVEQLAVLGVAPGTPVTLRAGDGEPIRTDQTDELGSLLFRDLPANTEFSLTIGTSSTELVTTLGRDEHPPVSFHAEQQLTAPGFGYLTTRDGTTLSATVWLPGPVEEGPYPTVVEYSGYSPSDPDSTGFGDIFTALGYAYVGVNMRGTGCSGGSFRYFEYAQSLDGYDIVETIAAQPWVLHGHVGMVGISYPGISQLFVAQTQPPSLAAITPLSVLDDSFQANLYPGGILNTGFAVDWTRERVEEAQPEGQAWAAARIAAGDTECADNQRLRLQNPDLLAEILASPFWESPLGDELAPRTFVDRIEVPVFLAGAWQDEQTGGRFPTMIDRFTSSPALYVSLVNGLHTEALSPPILPRLAEFLELYVAERTPSIGILPVLAPLVGGAIFGTTDFGVRGDRFDGMSYDDALATFESEPRIEIHFEQGAVEGRTPGSPMPRFSAGFDAWPIPDAVVTEWSLAAAADGGGPGTIGRLVGTSSDSDTPRVTDGESTYLALPDGLDATFYEGSSSGIWRADVVYDWREPAPGAAAVFVSDPLADDTVVIGSGSVDLWVRSNLGDTDLEVTVSEIRPDGTEVYVQSGWLRTTHRTLDEAASTVLRPVHTHLESDAAPLPDDRFEPVRVELYPFAHPFRAGSRLRLTVDAPGGNRPVWAFATIAGGEQVTIAHDADHPSRLVLAVVPGIEVPPGVPPCGALRGQPCRTP